MIAIGNQKDWLETKWNAEARSAEASYSKNAELTIVRRLLKEARTFFEEQA